MFNKNKQKDQNKEKKDRKKNRNITKNVFNSKMDFSSKTITKNPHGFLRPSTPIVKKVLIYESITVFELAQKMAIKADQVVKIMMKMGVIASSNQSLDIDTASLVVREIGHIPLLTNNNKLSTIIEESNNSIKKNRSPVVAIMGHVDHGKTTLLDTIRNSNVVDKEFGNITQHISSYKVKTKYGIITFLDTPGHAFFNKMRSRGAECTDIVLLVIAADDGIMPQTLEAINYIKKYKVSVIVVINKIDKDGSNVQKVINNLLLHDIVPEKLGGDTIVVEVSAKTKVGISNLLESIILQSEILDLKSDFDCLASGIVIESKINKKVGISTIIIVKNGKLKKGDIVLSGIQYGKIRLIRSDSGCELTYALPSDPVEVIGLSGCALSGDNFCVINNEKKVRGIVSDRIHKKRQVETNKLINSDNLFNFDKSNIKVINIILKGDVYGSVEALKNAIMNIQNDNFKIAIVHYGVGDFNESDVNFCLSFKAIMIGFNVKISSIARKLINKENIRIKIFHIVYEVIDYILDYIKKRTIVKKKEYLGELLVKNIFNITKNKIILGCIVLNGLLKKSNNIKVIRDDIIIYDGKIDSLRRFKESTNEVTNGMECGLSIKNCLDVKVNDVIKVY